MIDHCQEGDTIVICKLDRLGRSLAHLVQIVTELETAKIGLISLNDPIDTTTAQGRLVFRLFASLAEFDHSGEPSGADPGVYGRRFNVSPATWPAAGPTGRNIRKGSTHSPSPGESLS